MQQKELEDAKDLIIEYLITSGAAEVAQLIVDLSLEADVVKRALDELIEDKQAEIVFGQGSTPLYTAY